MVPSGVETSVFYFLIAVYQRCLIGCARPGLAKTHIHMIKVNNDLESV